MEQTHHFVKIRRSQKPCLIINADDLGICAERDEAIFSLIQSKFILSASLIINGPSALTAIQTCLDLRFIPGIHFNLTEGIPLSQPQCIPSLVDPTTRKFLGKQGFYEAFSNDKISLYEADQELYLQLSKFVEMFGTLPSHFDGHNHIHILDKGIASVVANLCKQFGLYKGRMPLQDKELFLKPESISQFNKSILEKCAAAKKLFVDSGFAMTDCLVGLDLITDVSQQNFKQTAALLLKYMGHNDLRTAELMVHPGRPSDKGDSFNQSPDRQTEYNVLKSPAFKQIIQKDFQISSWSHIALPKSQGQLRILIHSSMKRGTGNHTTALRLRQIFCDLGYKVYLRDIHYSDKLATHSEIQSLHDFCVDFRIDFIFGIHLFRSGAMLLKAFKDKNKIQYRVPYMLMIAGTDANIFINRPQCKPLIIEAIAKSQMLVALNPALFKIVEQTLKASTSDCFFPPTHLIPQSQSLFKSDPVRQKEALQQAGLGLGTKFIVFPASIRKVKDIGFALAQLNQFIEKTGIQVVLCGPITDPTYYESHINGKLGKVKFVGCIDRERYMELLLLSMCLINTSISEGMSNALLQAKINGIPIIARDNQGNKNLVQHEKTGLLFCTAGELYDLLTNYLTLAENQRLLRQLSLKGSSQALKQFSYAREKECYKKILDSHFANVLKVDNIRILNTTNVHPASAVNLQLFKQIQSMRTDYLWDIGCGTAVFALCYLQKLKQNCHGKPVSPVKQIVLGDVCLQALSTSYFNCVNNLGLLQSLGYADIVLIYSDMYKQISQCQAVIKKDKMLFGESLVVLGNMPQTPFPTVGVKLDRNGGIDGLALNTRFIAGSVAHSPAKLFVLHSELSYPAQFFKLIQYNGYEIQSCTQPFFHKIPVTDYEKMCPGLFPHIQTARMQGKSVFTIQEATQKGRMAVISTKIYTLIPKN